MNKLMAWFQRRAGLADGAVVFVRDTATASNQRVTMGDWLVWGQIFDPNINQDTIRKLFLRALDWRNNNMVVHV
jgi:hypothetical protein